MGDQGSLNQLLQWSIEHSTSSPQTQQQVQEHDASIPLSSRALAELLGGPSDADRMRAAMTAILAPTAEVDLPNKLIAWDNLQLLVENIDNANNMPSIGLWEPLLAQLDVAEPECRCCAAGCVAAAVQNNIKSQEVLHDKGGVGRLVKVVLEDGEILVRRRAVAALSAAVRNFQPALDDLEEALPDAVWRRKGLEAGDMAQVDELIARLREVASSGER